MEALGNDQLREWWLDHLGARPDPQGYWQISDPSAHPDIGTPGKFRTLSLNSYGSALDAELFQPEGGLAKTVVIVPFYDAASVFGLESARTRISGKVPQHPLGPALARARLSVLAVPWWFETDAADDDAAAAATSLAERYGPAAARHARTLPMTALGRSIGDLMLAVRAVLQEGLADPDRLGVFGHSLGGKLSLHLGALDPHVNAVACHEPGLGFAFSNWSDPWYLGSKIPADRDQDEIVELVAPRPLLLVGGGDSDGEHNRHLIDGVTHLWGDVVVPQWLHHNGGHPMPAHVLAACTAWLHESLTHP
ncbi:prolyl oligopeptidase family serine peptidase [Pseudactinotalea sp. Z1739]|uniref:alpha/beta hydrolase family protein n=1 Tax=Pseudactinotalea sp. Z1739 TaxID=3413028 RepID=UPI003C7B40FC